MNDLFKILGVCVCGYVVYGYKNREIYARSGIWGRAYRRDLEPAKYWGAMISYLILAILLFFVFGYVRR